ncbi:MAG: 1-phosphofructokinase [Oscillospiraceae bacterium]|nr:1-phosphofructokinase [Oscillospiraceae bacterium]
MIYTITLNPALDYVMNTETINTSDINRTISEEIYYGGKGINVSTVLSRLGYESTSLGFIAGFTGSELESMMKADGLLTDFTRIENGRTRINVKVKCGVEIDINANGPDIPSEKLDELINKLNSLNSGDYLVLAGSVPNSVPSDIYANILKLLSGKDVKIIVDSTGEQLLKTLEYKPFLVKPNHHELGELFDKELIGTDEIIEYAKRLRSMGPKNVIVSRGGDGSIFVDENDKVYVMAPVPGKLVNSVGCGDSMVAGFIAGLCEKDGDYEYALKLATACGSATAFSMGLASRQDVIEILERI